MGHRSGNLIIQLENLLVVTFYLEYMEKNYHPEGGKSDDYFGKD